MRKRKLISCCLVFVLLLSLVGCGEKSKKQDELLEYINDIGADMGTIESKLIASYESVTGDNYTNDQVAYTEFTTNTIELARKLNDEAVKIAGTISDEEILEVHRIYMDYSNKFLSMLNLMISALKNQDMSQISEANEKLNEANNLAIDFRLALEKLAEKYDVEISRE